MRNRILVLILLALGTAGAPGQHPAKLPIETLPSVDEVNGYQACREYLPTRNEPCRVDFDMTQVRDGNFTPQVHKDIAVWPGPRGQAYVRLSHTSPFSSCSLTTSPAPIARDLSANISGLLTVLAGFGAPAIRRDIVTPEHHPALSSPPELLARERDIDARIAEANAALTAFNGDSPRAFNDLKIITDNYKYSYGGEPDAKDKLKKIYDAASDFLDVQLPDSKAIPGLQAKIVAIQSALNDLKTAFPNPPSRLEVDAFSAFVRATELTPLAQKINELQATLGYLGDAAKKVQSLIDVLAPLSDSSIGSFDQNHYTTQILPVAIYPENQVGVAVKCVDAVTQTQIFDTIQFNAFYQVPPTFDISVGFLTSFLKGRQVGTESGPYVASPATPTTVLAVTSNSRVQFIPGTFVEYHPWNFRLPWAQDPALAKSQSSTWMSLHASRHPFGYVGSFGLAGGFLVNPNNGTGQAEFFEGISLGIQRFSILVGNHTGRSQNFISGYQVNQTVPSGTVPPTTRNWGNGLAIGLAYRVALR